MAKSRKSGRNSNYNQSFFIWSKNGSENMYTKLNTCTFLFFSSCWGVFRTTLTDEMVLSHLTSISWNVLMAFDACLLPRSTFRLCVPRYVLQEQNMTFVEIQAWRRKRGDDTRTRNLCSARRHSWHYIGSREGAWVGRRRNEKRCTWCW